ncbi:O-methyltransferase [Arsenicibacter rosenii]|uniref:SAM-dependent methyltransferase n=1 Tax=Arsenicibacter rosenii TaxID=1750698 RepID=A0A1S2VHW4_9BACT|nr:class I SAM-dependent methyltransferase [Arsenicibacter rosenii]OIN58341.1 SAM-dependent methyltransferase [Arsenicibacter rosenii]
MIIPYLRYIVRAGNEHSLHSPFLFDLYRQTIRPGRKSAEEPFFTQIEALRRELKQSREELAVVDLGAGSRLTPANTRTVGAIARHSAKPPAYAQLLYRLTQRFQTRTIFDLGTSLGLTTAYLAKGADKTGGFVTSFEGCPATAEKARQHLNRLGCKAVEVVTGDLAETLPRQVDHADRLDLVFFDANHRYTPTVQYFNVCLPKKHNDSVFIFDDIHWSDEMEQAWATIKEHPDVTATVDLFGVGLVFFRKEQLKQHFTLRF